MSASLIKSILAGGLLLIGSTGFAQEMRPPGVWDFDSITPASTSTSSKMESSHEVYDFLVKMVNRWNAHDLDGYLACFWNSPSFVGVFDSEVYIGWHELQTKYKAGFGNPEDMGAITPTRVQVRMVKEDLALALTRWTVTLPRPGHTLVGVDTNYLQKFDDGWKVISAHTSSTEM